MTKQALKIEDLKKLFSLTNSLEAETALEPSRERRKALLARQIRIQNNIRSWLVRATKNPDN